MPPRLARTLALLSLAPSLACLADRAPATPALQVGPLAQLTIRVADFALPLMTDACFSVTVFDTDDPASFVPGHEVWTASALCSTQHGSVGFALDYAGGCDHQAPGGVNTVRLVLDALYMGGDAGGAGVALPTDFYDNPCPPGSNACALTVPCTDNASWQVDFDLAVTSRPDMGVFDTRVWLGDVACSARLDCEEHGGAPLMYLTDPGTGRDGPTAVFGFACALPADAPAASLLIDDLTVACDNGWTATVDPSAAVGLTAPDDPHGLLFAASIQRGDASERRSYWNVLLGLDLDQLANAGTCTLTTQATASETASCQTPAPARHPVIHWEVELTADGSAGGSSPPTVAASSTARTRSRWTMG